MITIPQKKAVPIANPAGIPPRVRCAQTPDDARQYTAKPIRWIGSDAYAIRLGVEYFYHVLADANKVPMPAACVLEFEGKLWWGMQILDGRRGISEQNDVLDAQVNALILTSLDSSQTEREGLIRAAFIDTMLLSQDRTETNILSQPVGDRVTLTYFDHEQSLGWRNDITFPEKNVILPPAEEFARENKPYGKTFRNRKWALGISSSEQRRVIFEALTLDPAMLDEIKLRVPHVWMSDDWFKTMRPRLAAWWDFLRHKPYPELDASIFGVP